MGSAGHCHINNHLGHDAVTLLWYALPYSTRHGSWACMCTFAHGVTCECVVPGCGGGCILQLSRRLEIYPVTPPQPCDVPLTLSRVPRTPQPSEPSSCTTSTLTTVSCLLAVWRLAPRAYGSRRLYGACGPWVTGDGQTRRCRTATACVARPAVKLGMALRGLLDTRA